MDDDQNTDIHEVSGKSPEFRTELAKQLEELVPEAIADGKVDVVKLKELLAEDAGDTTERFGLFWPGKKRAMRAAQDPTTATLKPAKDLSKDWDTTQNIFIEGDNLEVLKVLQKQYHNSIKMIYIDPPYNTGKDFVYPDNFKEGLQNYLEFSKQVDAGGKKISTNAETAGRYHSNWLNMMYPRLKLARNLLTDDGVIFISIDDNEYANLKKTCDEIFGEQNFVDSIVWKKRYQGAKEHYHAAIHEYILVYARRLSSLEDFSITASNDFFKKYFKGKDDKYDTRGGYRTQPLEAGGTMDARANLRYDIHLPDGRVIAPKRQWIWSKERVQDAIAKDNLEIIEKTDGSYSVRFKQYEKDENGVRSRTKPFSIIDFVFTQDGTKEMNDIMGSGIFQFPKPSKLIRHLIDVISSKHKDFIVLDMFSGSGTTAHAVMQLNAEDGGNRKHIQVQLPEPTDEKSEAYKAGYRKISDIARERINRAGEKIKADFADKLAERDTPLDVGYRTYRLSDTNFRKWQSSATNDLGELQARLDLMRESTDDNASEEDLLVEIMLKMGLPLTTRTVEREVSSLTVHQVVPADDENADVQPVFYLNEHVKPSLEQLRTIVTELTPSKFVILDDAFQGDNELKTNLVQTCKSYNVELWTV